MSTSAVSKGVSARYILNWSSAFHSKTQIDSYEMNMRTVIVQLSVPL